MGVMFGWDSLAKFIMITGVLLVALGPIPFLAGRIPFLGRLPGDIAIERETFRFYVPLTTCILLSALLTLVAWLLGRRG
jgi:hypothetical protein